MSAITDLFTHLTTDGTLAGKIGTRLYPSFAPQDATLPFVVYYEFANPREQGFGNVVQVNKPRIQYSIYGEHYDDCVEVADALRGALITFESPVTFEDERAYHDVTTGLYRRDVDARVPHV